MCGLQKKNDATGVRFFVYICSFFRRLSIHNRAVAVSRVIHRLNLFEEKYIFSFQNKIEVVSNKNSKQEQL